MVKDPASIRYRCAELESLDRTAIEYLPSIQIYDGKGGKTKHLAINYDELNDIAKVLLGEHKPKGDKCFADTLRVKKDGRKVVLFAEVDGMHFDSTEYPTKKAWLNAIVRRVYACAMGQLN